MFEEMTVEEASRYLTAKADQISKFHKFNTYLAGDIEGWTDQDAENMGSATVNGMDTVKENAPALKHLLEAGMEDGLETIYAIGTLESYEETYNKLYGS